MTKKMRIPTWAYVVAALLGPAILFSVITFVFTALDALFDLLAKFDYWWVVAAVIGYLLAGVVIAGSPFHLREQQP